MGGGSLVNMRTLRYLASLVLAVVAAGAFLAIRSQSGASTTVPWPPPFHTFEKLPQVK
jgi:hypothetical protein